VSYRGIVLPPAAVAFVGKGGRDLPLALAGVTEPLEAGRPLRLVGPSGQSLGLALADPENERLRVMARAGEAVDSLGPAFFAARVERALALRRTLGLVGERSACRLVHGAGDGLPGFTADLLGPWAVVCVYSRAFVPHGQLLAQAAIEQAGLRGVVVKVRSRGAASQQRVRQEAVGAAPPETLVVEERGVPFEVHPDRGLNTGLFTDMREHRHGLARFVAGQAVLNGFGYTGTLSVAAARRASSA
jgi:23S rRNA (cytosine1962-C5)-methyltransferase